jgi:hypothetical protein
MTQEETNFIEAVSALEMWAYTYPGEFQTTRDWTGQFGDWDFIYEKWVQLKRAATPHQWNRATAKAILFMIQNDPDPPVLADALTVQMRVALCALSDPYEYKALEAITILKLATLPLADIEMEFIFFAKHSQAPIRSRALEMLLQLKAPSFGPLLDLALESVIEEERVFAEQLRSWGLGKSSMI